MGEEGDNTDVNSPSSPRQITDRDSVSILSGTWIRENDGRWIFDSITEEGSKTVMLKSDLEYEQLVAMVKDRLGAANERLTVKLSFQYPSWLEIGDGDGSTPEFISDDFEVDHFVQFRREIEEVNLCVTLSKANDGVSNEHLRPRLANVTDQTLLQKEGSDTQDSEEHSEGDWMDFAMSETPMTLPQEPNSVGGRFARIATQNIPITSSGIEPLQPVAESNFSMPPRQNDLHRKGKAIADGVEVNIFTNDPAFNPQRRRLHMGRGDVGLTQTIPYRAGGIEIREPQPGGRIAVPQIPKDEKGKGKEHVTHPETDSDDDDCVVPQYVLTEDRHVPQAVERNKVRRRLFDETEMSVEPDNDPSSAEPEPMLTQPTVPDTQANKGNTSTGLTHWTRFQDSLQEILNDESSQNVLFGRDAPPVVDSMENEGLEAALDVVQYEGDNLFVGQVFKSKSDCKIKIAIHAINRKFHFKIKRSTPKFMVIICVATDCPWRVYATRVDETGIFQIRQATLSHCCSIDARRNYHRLATTQVIGQLIQSRFIAIKRGPSPATIRKMLLDDFHVNVSYWKSWRGREVGMELALGSMAGAYALMPAYLGLLQTTNPGSICSLYKEENASGSMSFKYAFITYGASVKGYRFMRKVIIIDGTSLKGRYGGCLLSACAQDGNFQIFPLGFAIVDSENDDAWEWFLTQLKSFVADSEDLVIVSDRHGSIYNAIAKVYPYASHGACTVHLWRNIRARFKSKRIASLMGAAARAYTVGDFNRKFLDIQRVSPGCAAYLVDIGFEHWTRAHFQGERFNIMDSNIAESWNVVLAEAREYPLISMCEYIRTTLMSWFAIRRAKSLEHKGTLTPRVRMLVKENFLRSTAFAVTGISEMEFQIQAPLGEYHVVNIMAGTCSCNAFEQLRIPCRHAVAAAGRAGVPTDAMVASAYHADTWHSAYEGKIYPIPSVGAAEIGGTFTGELQPPDVRRPPGRPRKVRILSTGEDKRGCRKCSRCRGECHNKASCRRAI